MANPAQAYIDELYKQGLEQAEKRKADRVKTDEEAIREMEAAVDQSTASASQAYERELERLPEAYRELYDANAVQELVNQRQVQERMANLGLTDSGLNRTQQTAIALQRGNADAAARLSEREKTQELQDKLAQIQESGAAQKRQQATAIRGETADWYNNLTANVYNNAVSQGTSRYNAEQERAAAERQAQLEAQQEAERQRQTAAQQARQWELQKALNVVETMRQSGASTEQQLAYLQSAGLIGDLPMGSAAVKASGSAASGAVKESGSAAAGSGAASAEIKKAEENTPKKKTLRISSLQDIERVLTTKEMDQKTKDSAYYRANYVKGKMETGRMTREEAVADLVEQLGDNPAGMLYAADRLGLTNPVRQKWMLKGSDQIGMSIMSPSYREDMTTLRLAAKFINFIDEKYGQLTGDKDTDEKIQNNVKKEMERNEVLKESTLESLKFVMQYYGIMGERL